MEELGVHELVEPLRSDLLSKSRDMERESLVFLAGLRVGREGIRQLSFGNIPEVRLFVFLELVLPLQVVFAKRNPANSQ